MASVHQILLRIVTRECATPNLQAALMEAGHYYDEDYINAAMFGEVDLELEFLRNVSEVLGLEREEVRDLGEAHLLYIRDKETTDNLGVSA